MSHQSLFCSGDNKNGEMSVKTVLDPEVPFPAYFVHGIKTEQRKFVAEMALSWIRVRSMRGAHGCIMFDIDDTIINGNDSVKHGFEYMQHLYSHVSLLYPIHIVTARPDDQHAQVMRMLHNKKFYIPVDRLHMLPEKHYGKDTKFVERFKWECFQKMEDVHGRVVARFGDKLWDVAHLKSLRTYMAHVKDSDCYVFMDPTQKGTLSVKLPG
jgi:hypothetical protein